MGSQLSCDTLGFITELSSLEFIRNKNLIELGQLAMREQLEVAEIFFPMRWFCWFSGKEGALATRPFVALTFLLLLLCSLPHLHSFSHLYFWTWWLFSFSSGKLLCQWNWCCFDAIIFIMSVAGLASPSVRVACAGWVTAPLTFESLACKYRSLTSSSLSICYPTVLNTKHLQCFGWN